MRLRSSLIALGTLGLLLTAATEARAQSCTSADPKDWPAPAKPYFMILVDTSGSMAACAATGFANEWPNSCPSTAPKNSCGLEPTRLNEAKCALRKTVLAFAGESNFGLATFSRFLTGCNGAACVDSCTAASGSGCGIGTVGEGYTGNGCSVGGTDCGAFAACNSGATPSAPNLAAGWQLGGRVVADMLQDPLPWGGSPPATNVSNILKWFDGTCDNNELFAGGNTPIPGALQTIHEYFISGFSSSWSATNYCAATALTATTPLTTTDPACRSLNVILVTDGVSTCDETPDSPGAAALLYNTGVTVGGKTFRIRTHVIGFGSVASTSVDPIADRGDDGLANNSKAALKATDEKTLSSALASIIAGAIKPEVCDNIDNNCNGCIDEGYKHYCNRAKAASATPNNDSQCCSLSRTTCLQNFKNSITTANPNGDRFWLPCFTPTGSLTQPLSESASWLCEMPVDVCDNADNNCDGTTPNASVIDENQVKCGGKCPTTETCNGIDDNCNGVIDEKAGGGAYSLVGCSKCVPSAEICDGCDNDCDGVADDNIASVSCGLSSPANCAGTISCQTPQTVPVGTCIGGAPSNRWGTCSNTSSKEICDGIDNDCNGTPDDGVASTPCDVPNTSGLNYGANSQCKRGQKNCGGQCSGWIGPSQEICDGKDNDCDGLVDALDPDLAGDGQPCGSSQGICTKGTSACVGGVLVCTGGKLPQAEICDGNDNDCNGFVDDGALADSPSASAKSCWNLPSGTCTPNCSYVGSNNTALWCPPSGATCQGIGTLKAPCSMGSLVCQSGGWKCLGGLGPSKEVCDGVDNDCNGAVDNAIATTTCGTSAGECSTGTQVCSAGKIDCQGATNPVAELCDNKDNDCDGVIDNGIAINEPCSPSYDKAIYPGDRSKGECKPGSSKCGPSGQVICENGVGPKPELCDGKDNDCDGLVDEPGDAPNGINASINPLDKTQKIGDSCGKDQTPCKPGNYACANGLFVCIGGVAPQPEVCDCIDNDCDGKIDEDPTAGTTEAALCGAAKECVTYKGSCQCAAKCKAGEFPCPTGGFDCMAVDKSGLPPPLSAGSRCVADPSQFCDDCASKTVTASSGQVECAPLGYDAGSPAPVCECKTVGQPACHRPCFGVTCAPPTVCTDYGPKAGQCAQDNCWNIPCVNGKVCNDGACKDNSCKPSSCPADKVCKPSSNLGSYLCVNSCESVVCKNDEKCVSGTCQATGCPAACSNTAVCDPKTNSCVASKCTANTCANGSYCDPLTGACGNEPCAGILCPSGQSCSQGECFKTLVDGGTDANPDGAGGADGGANDGSSGGAAGAVEPQTQTPDRGNWGLATGGGGCACETSSLGSSRTTISTFSLLGLWALLSRRKGKKRGGDANE